MQSATGSPLEPTVLELALRVLQLTGSDSVLEYHPLPSDDPVRRRPDISRAHEHLQWAPLVTLDDGLQRTIGYFSQTRPVQSVRVFSGLPERRVQGRLI